MSNVALPLLPSAAIIRDRLPLIFPEGSPNRAWCTRDFAVRTIFTLFYIGAIDGSDRYLGPKHVYRMSDDQAARGEAAERLLYARDSAKPGYVPRGQAWYADTTREPIRDETLRYGLMPVGAVVKNEAVATTSSKPRYALAKDFAALFDSSLLGKSLDEAIAAWQARHLSAQALARVKIVRAGRTAEPSGVTVKLPSGDTRRLAAGDSSQITKYVIEEFASRFLSDPAVLWISESANKVEEGDNSLVASFRLLIDQAKDLPDIILADVAREDEMLLVFVEVVASDGPVSQARRDALLQLALRAGFPAARVAFVTAYLDRSSAVLKKNLPDLAWNTFVWLASEPDNIIALFGGEAGKPRLLSSMLVHGS